MTSVSSLTPLLVALDHLDEDTRGSLQRLAQRVSQVCEDQGVTVSPIQALDVAQRALAPLPDAQMTRITDHQKEQPLTQAAWDQAKAQVKQALSRSWRKVVAIAIASSICPVLFFSCFGVFSHLTPQGVSMAVPMMGMLGLLTGGIAFIIGTDIVLKPHRHRWREMQEADPEDGWDHLRGKHWSESTQALSTYHCLKQPDVPLLERDLDLLLEVAQADWDREESRAIQQRLKSSPLKNREPA